MARPRLLSHRIEAIEYTHARDGLAYRHDFERADSEIALNDDGSVTIRNAAGRPLWGTYGGKPFLENPPHEGRTMKRSKKKRPARRAGTVKKARRSTARKKPGHTKRAAAYKLVSMQSHTSGGTMARKRSSSRARGRRRNPPASRRSSHRRKKSYRRNPPSLSARGVINSAMDGALNGATVLAGEVGARVVSGKLLGYAPGSSAGVAIQAATGLAIGLVGPRFIGVERSRFAMAGAFASAGRALAKNFATDTTTKVTAPWYGDYLGELPSRAEIVAAYPARSALGSNVGDPYNSLSSYPSAFDGPTSTM